VVFDWLHHQANSGSGDVVALLRDVFDTWRAGDGRPKTHLSSQLQGGRLGQHDDWVRLEDARALLGAVPREEFDCMLEAKRKDQALFRLRGQLGIEPRPAGWTS
jgi:UV DNA damage endonuclease